MLIIAVVTGAAMVGAIWVAGQIGELRPVLQPVPVPARKKTRKS